MQSQDAEIIFLDIDGVLHPSSAGSEPDLRFLPKFEEFLRQFPTIEVVISSSWRESRTLTQLRALFSPDLSARIIDVTPVLLIDDVVVRQREIESWLNNRLNVTRWLAIDDDSENFDLGCRNLFLCDERRGLDAAAIDELANIFSRNKAPSKSHSDTDSK